MKEENKKPEEVNPPKAETKNVPQPQQPQQPMREIIISTNGDLINVTKAEVTNLEFKAILSILSKKFE